MSKQQVKAMDLPAEEYFRQEHEDEHPVVWFEVVGPMSLHLRFDDGKEATIDFEPALRLMFTGPAYEPLFDPEYFAQVRTDEYGILTWPNGTDFNPAYIYDWPKWIEPVLAEMAPATSPSTKAVD